MIEKLSTEKTLRSGFTVVEGRLLFKQRLVIPVNYPQIPLILREWHESVFGGHAGVLRTLQRVKATFY